MTYDTKEFWTRKMREAEADLDAATQAQPAQRRCEEAAGRSGAAEAIRG